MIAVDTSSVLAFLSDDGGDDVERVDSALRDGIVIFPAVVVTELFSARNLSVSLINIFREIPLLDLLPGFWERAGRLRSKVLGQDHKAKLADALIAQSCIDHHVGLITRDRDFRHYLAHGLKLV